MRYARSPVPCAQLLATRNYNPATHASTQMSEDRIQEFRP